MKKINYCLLENILLKDFLGLKTINVIKIIKELPINTIIHTLKLELELKYSSMVGSAFSPFIVKLPLSSIVV